MAQVLENRGGGRTRALAAAAAQSGRLRLRTLVVIRWVAILGQIAALLIVHFVLRYPVPIAPALCVIAASVLVNLWSSRRRASARLGDRAAAVYLAYDLLQLAALLYLTGGMHNPFAILILAPVTVSATSLSRESTGALAALALATLVFLSYFHLPLPWPNGSLGMQPVFVIGFAVALCLSIVFIAAYLYQVAEESRRMSDALSATQMALDRAQRVSAVGSLAAAAAHELGSPLGTIAVVAREIARDLPSDSPLRGDIELLLSQSARCGDILARLSARPDAPETVQGAPQSLSALVAAAAEPYARKGVRLRVEAQGQGEEPVLATGPEILHGLGNLLENAVEFARSTVRVAIRWDGTHISVTIRDDGPGFDPGVIQHLGEPYISGGPQGRHTKSVHMGLGVFIAETLLERTGASLTLDNAAEGGAEVVVSWPRAHATWSAPGAKA